MSLLDYLRILHKRWLTVVVLTVLGVAVGAGVTALIPRTYEAQSTSLVTVTSAGSDANGTAIYQGSQFTVQRAQSYVELAGSAQVLSPVINRLGLHSTVLDLRKKVTAQNPQDTALLQVQASDGDAKTAAAIANAVASQMRSVIEKLETPAGATRSLVIVAAINPADTPTAPASPRLALDLALGLLVGIALGIIVAVIRDQLDTRVSAPEELRALTGAVPLGAVEFVRDVNQVVDQRAAFSSIRTNLRLSNVDTPIRSVVVTSTLPDEGRTTTIGNLAIVMARSGTRVCVLEADLHRPKVAAYLGAPPSAGLADVLCGDRELDDVTLHRAGLPSVITAGRPVPDPGGLLGSVAMENVVAGLALRFECVLIDVPPLLTVADGAAVARIADGAVLVVRHRHTRREQLRRATELLAGANARLLGTVRTFVPPAKASSYAVPRMQSPMGQHRDRVG